MAATPATTPAPAAPPPARLRSDLRITVNEEGGFVIEDPRAGKFFRVGPAEYAILAQLDGLIGLREAWQRGARGQGAAQLPADRLPALASWLQASGLVDSAAGNNPASVNPALANEPGPSFNPCYFRFPLGIPEKSLAALEWAFGWLCSVPALAVVMLFTVGAAIIVAQQWAAITGSLQSVWCPDQHLALLGCWLVLKLAHELGHAIACRRLGGEVREWGLAFMYLMPVPYTDVTSSWRFSARSDRMAVAAAGMYFEWILALGALLVWSYSTSPAVRQLCVYAMSLATLTTVLFNANPLCRLDGYYLLSDLLRWPNLAAQGQRLTSGLWRQLWGGKVASDPGISRGRWWFALSYGIAASLWRLVALFTMAAVVVIAYEGVGVLLIAGVLVVWYGPFRAARPSSTNENAAWFPEPRRLAWLSASAGCLLLFVCFVPWPIPIAAPGVAESVDQHIVRARAAGLVTNLSVKDGQWVEAGQELAVLSNDELAFELAQLEREFELGETKLRSLYSKRQLVDYQVEQERQETLAARIAEHQRRLETLILKAPSAGRVSCRRLVDLPGSFLKEGAELCVIVTPGMKFQASIAQRDLPYFARCVDRPIVVRLPGRNLLGRLTHLEPQASTELSSPALSAATGGPLPVVPNDANQTQTDSSAAMKLVEPRVTATVALRPEDSSSLYLGQRGSALVHPPGRTIAGVLHSWGRNWWATLCGRAQAQ